MRLGRLFLFIVKLEDQFSNAKQYKTKGKKTFVCNHSATPSLGRGKEIITPSYIKGVTAYRVW